MQITNYISSLKEMISGAVKMALIASLFIYSTMSLTAQTTKTMRMPQASTTIAEALSSLEKQSGMRFSWDRTFDITKTVVLPTSDVSFDEVMRILLNDSNHTYATSSSFILIKPQTAEVKAEVKPKTPVPTTIQSPQAIVRKISGLATTMGGDNVIYNAVVTLKGEGRTYSTTTDRKGYFEVNNLLKGVYNINVSHLDYGSSGFDVTVTDQKDESVVIAMQALKSEVKASTFSSATHVNSFTSVPTPELKQSLNPTLKQAVPRIAIKTNLIYDALRNINLGFEIRLSPRMTLDIPVNYNGWKYSNNKRLNNIMVQPELRLWVHESFNGHFFGLHAHYAHFNTGGIKAPFGLWKEWRTSRYQGDLYGAGLSYGYQWILAKRWNLEATVGLGYFHAKYDRFECQDCGNVITKGATKDYFGLTKLGLSLIYIIK